MSLRFSDKPGRRERHLRRKHDNPLFAPGQRPTDQSDVDDARRADEAEQAAFREAFHALVNRAAALAGTVQTEAILEIKEEIERLYEQCMGLGGDYEAERQALGRLNGAIMKAIRHAAAGDTVAAEELEREATAREMHLRLLEYPLVADLLWRESPIEPDELAPSLLSESAETVQVVMSLFQPEQQAELRAQGRHLLQQLQQRGEDSAQLREKLAAMEAARQ